MWRSPGAFSREFRERHGVSVGGATISVTGGDAHVGAPDLTSSNAHETVRATEKLDTAILRTQAKQALTGLGWKPAIAQAAVAAALAAQGAGATLERLIFEALRRCPIPKT